MFVYLYPFSLVVLHPYGLEVEALHVGSPPGSYQDLIHRDLFFSSPAFNMDNFVPIFLSNSFGLTVEDQADSITDEGLLENFCRIIVLSIQDMRGIVKKGNLSIPSAERPGPVRSQWVRRQ